VRVSSAGRHARRWVVRELWQGTPDARLSGLLDPCGVTLLDAFEHAAVWSAISRTDGLVAGLLGARRS